MSIVSTTLEANLNRVFNERDAIRRGQAIQELYAADATFYEQQATFSGTDAIIDAVTHLIGSLPPTLRFVVVSPAMVNHDMGKLLWRGELSDGKIVVTGTDIAHVENGRIRSLYVFVDG
ncbi:MAG: nuclear transport factor 2 family protein [Polyangiaceae bacterium]